MMNERAPPLVTPTPSPAPGHTHPLYPAPGHTHPLYPAPPLKKGMNSINEIKKKHDKKE